MGGGRRVDGMEGTYQSESGPLVRRKLCRRG